MTQSRMRKNARAPQRNRSLQGLHAWEQRTARTKVGVKPRYPPTPRRQCHREKPRRKEVLDKMQMIYVKMTKVEIKKRAADQFLVYRKTVRDTARETELACTTQHCRLLHAYPPTRL